MVVAADVGEADNITPKNKRTVAERLVLKALGIAYGFDVVHAGPVFAGEEYLNGTVRIRFANAESGLRVIGQGEIGGFAIAGEDRLFRWAEVRIEGSCVVVSHPDVYAPVAVRYAWEANPSLRLFSGDGFPVAPFRTDSWPGITEVKTGIREERAVQ
jgi:sialate O-acetylesterase